MSRPASLDVYFGDDPVGTIHDSSPLAFKYASAWLERADAWPIAGIPLQNGYNNSTQMQAFFENLLPEGELRLYIAEQRKASTLFSLLLEVAGDTAGGFIVLPAGQKPTLAKYEATSWEEIAAQMRKSSAVAIDIHSGDARISLAGAQDKTSIAIFEDGVPRLPRGAAPSTHILKPDIKRLSKVWHSAANETIIMQTAANCGLPTAQVFYEPLTQSCIVRRFDRITKPDGTLGRLMQYDLCQLSGALSDRKYESEGGPSLANCAALIRQYSTQPAVDLRYFIQWILFNLYVGNNDSHAKNLSVYQTPGQGVTLTPFYDLLCTRLYPGLSQAFAFSIGGETKPGSITKENVTAMAEQLRISPQFVVKQAQDLAQKMPDAIAQAVESVSPALSSDAQALAYRLTKFVLTTTKKTAVRITQ
jgi:serine/threonine-protein kinase HipA